MNIICPFPEGEHAFSDDQLLQRQLDELRKLGLKTDSSLAFLESREREKKEKAWQSPRNYNETFVYDNYDAY